MNKTLIALLAIAFIASAIGLFVSKPAMRVVNVGAGSTIGGPYFATTTDSTWNEATKFRVLKTGAGVFGSVVITDSTTGSLTLYDATTTSSHTNHATTTLAVIAASASEATYIYDIGFTRGLIAVFEGAGAASSTITFQ